MSKIIKLLLFVSSIVTLACNDSLKERELALKERELSIREKELASEKKPIPASTDNMATPTVSNPQTQEVKKNKKYIFVVLKAKQPALHTVTNKQEYSTDAGGISVPIGDKYSYVTLMETNYYTSEVIEVGDYSIAKQYKLMDQFEFQIKEKIEEDDRQYYFEVNTKVYSNRDGYHAYASEIVNRKFFVYDTYEKASIECKKSIRL